MKINIIEDPEEITLTKTQYESLEAEYYHSLDKYRMFYAYHPEVRRPTFKEWLKAELKKTDHQ